ncbi:hypothetical protein LQW54_009429 [Pestalotiopsis sp. IQ-011]
MNPLDGGSHSILNACMRSNIFGADGYLVAYPLIGGLVFLNNPLAVDLQYLGLPNTHDTARSPDEDDELATRMVQLGAQWWPDWDVYLGHSSRIDDDLWRVKMRYVLTMDDKAEIMKDVGGTFYTSVDEAPGLANTVHESIDLFEPFKERLSNMEDAA